MARRKRQLVLMGAVTAEAGSGGGMPPLGTLKEVFKTLADFNTSTDGSPDKGTGTRLLHGPGFVIEVATALDPVSQGIVTINDEDIALPVLFRLCRFVGWRMMDMESGRTFG